MSEKNNNIKDKKDAALKQYDRFAGDLRFQHTLIWQIPSVALTITTGVVAVSLLHHGWARIVPLLLGGLLLFCLMIAVAKHRFTADARSQFLQNLECDLEVTKFPITTEQTRQYFDIEYTSKDKGKRLRRYLHKEGRSEDKLTRDPLFRFLIGVFPSAEMGLLWGMLIAFGLVFYLSINEILYFWFKWGINIG